MEVLVEYRYISKGARAKDAELREPQFAGRYFRYKLCRACYANARICGKAAEHMIHRSDTCGNGAV